jgi:hypothetical protein
MGWELNDVEQPFVAQLEKLGWTHIAGNFDNPAATLRTSFAEVIQESVLRERLRGVYRRGKPVHVVCGAMGDWLVIVTVYIPTPPKFKNPYERG